MVVTDLAAEIVALAGGLVDEGEIEVGPVVIEIGLKFDLDVLRAAIEIEDGRDKTLLTWRRAKVTS